MKRLAMALALTGALSITALAGNIPSTDVAAPTPPTDPIVTVLLTIINAVV